MKSSFRHPKFRILLTGSIIVAAATLAANPPSSIHKRGTDILHYFVRKAMFNTGVDSSAAASVNARQNQQGNANNQTLDITVKGLDTNTTYGLLALLDSDTNLTRIADFSTDAKGRASLLYRHLGNGHGLGRGKLPLPDALNPVSLVRELAIFNANTQAVLTADMTAPDKLEYLIKRDLSTNSVVASLQIKANQKHTQFKLQASGLNPANNYLLVLNSGLPQAYTTDAKGRLLIKSPMETPTDILDLRSVALWDSASNSVLSATLP
jgi:hypothetical protein